MTAPNREQRSARISYKCSSCGAKFTPHVRTRKTQKTCGKQSCVNAHRARYRRRYRTRNPIAESEYQDKRRNSRRASYWREYRATNPHYTLRNRQLSWMRARLKRQCLQRQLDILQVVESADEFERFMKFATSTRSQFDSLTGKEASTKEDEI